MISEQWSKLIADLGKARDCSTNLIKLSSSSPVLTVAPSPTVKDIRNQFYNSHVSEVKGCLNPTGFLYCIEGSKVTVILPSGGVSSVEYHSEGSAINGTTQYSLCGLT